VAPRHQFAGFAYGYARIYAFDLPVFITADMVLDAVHQSFGSILKRLEEGSLSPLLRTLLGDMRETLAAGEVPLDEQASQDVDVFLTVAESLLAGVRRPPLHAASSDLVASLYADAVAASGSGSATLFGTSRELDFSQLEPRGHYADSETLRHYFRAMRWLGRVDLRLIETDASSGEGRFQPRQLRAALALRALMSDESLERWSLIDRIGCFSSRTARCTSTPPSPTCTPIRAARCRWRAAPPCCTWPRAIRG
jgi:hypothetical protein